MLFADVLTLDAPRKTADGYLAVRAKAARTGVYQYTGAEVDPDNRHGLRDQDVVNVLRDEQTVFDKKAVHSFIGKPVTDNHPTEAVDANNWRDHARGVVMGAVRDGEHVAFDLLLTDAAAIGAVEAGKRELSNGYAADLEFGDYSAPDGTKCPVRQASIRGNHVAIVDRGRAGSECRIADAAKCTSLPADAFELLLDERTYTANPNDHKNDPARRETSNPGGGLRATQDGDRTVATKTITFDGLPLEVTDAAEAAITKLQNQFKDVADAKSKVETDLNDAKTKIAERDAEIVTLKQAVEDAKVTPAQLRDQAKAYALVCDKAKVLGVQFAEDADADAIMKAVVDAKMGDAAKDYDAKQIGAAFAVLTKDAKVDQPDPVRAALTNGVRSNDASGDIAKAKNTWLDAKRGAYRNSVGVN
jgi:hypothetical protein